jgi:Protein of unknown function (DUF2283)
VKIEYDEQIDAAYISLVDHIGAGGVAQTVPLDPRDETLREANR